MDFEKLNASNKMQSLQFHVLSCGTYTSDVCDPQYFDVLPVLDELETEKSVLEPSIIVEKSFLDHSSIVDESLDTPPPLEIIPNVSDIPSFLGSDFGDRQCGRITRSKSSRYNPIH